jgi:hypothetical protein
VDSTTSPFSNVAVTEDAPQAQVGGSDDRPTVAPADAVQATTVKAALTMRSVLVNRSRKILHSRFAPPYAPWADRLILLKRQSYAPRT